MTTETDQPLPPQKSNIGIIFAGVGFLVLCGFLYWGFLQEAPSSEAEAVVAPKPAPPEEMVMPEPSHPAQPRARFRTRR